MPWRKPEYPGEFPTLGYLVADWIQSYCVIPDREDAGQPFLLTDEQLRFLLFHYQLDPGTVRVNGRWLRPFVYERGSQLMRPHKWGKGPLAAAIICAEAAPDGPVLFDGWNGAGEPVGRPWPTPHVQVTANSEEQVGNVFRVLVPMLRLGGLASVFDVGLTRINTPTGGLIEPVTAAAVSRLGQRITFCLQDQTESWVASNGGIRLADNQRRGLAGTGGRFIETPNAYDPSEGSVAQLTCEGVAPGVYKDVIDPPAGSVRNKRERHKVLQAVYGDSTVEQGGWIDLGRIHAEIEALIEHDPAQAERWFLNRRLATEGAAFDVEAFKRLAKRRDVPAGEPITIGVDGARHDDAIAAVATDIRSGYQWPLIILERPPNAPDDYEHDLHQVDGALSEAFERWSVWRAYCDPHWIEGLIEGWQNRYGEKRIIHWLTNRPRPIAWAIRNWQQAITAGDLSHDGDETFIAHVANARRRKLTVLDDRERTMHTLCKDTVASPRKIDAAMAAILSWEARGDAIAAGVVFMGDTPEAPKPPEPLVYRPGFAPNLAAYAGVGEPGPMGSFS